MRKRHSIFFTYLLMVVLTVSLGWYAAASPQEINSEEFQEEQYVEEQEEVILEEQDAVEKQGQAAGIPWSIRLEPVFPTGNGEKPHLAQQLANFRKIVHLVKKKNRLHLLKPFSFELRERIAHLLVKSAELEQAPCTRNYFFTLAQNIAENAFFSCRLPRWSNLDSEGAEIAFITDDIFLGQLWAQERIFPFLPNNFNWERNSILNPVVFVNCVEETQKFEGYTNEFHALKNYAPLPAGLSTAYSPVFPSIKIVDYVFSAASPGFFTVYPALWNISGDSDQVDDRVPGECKIIIFKNIVDAYFEQVLKPIAGQVLAAPRLLDIDSDMFLSNLVMQRIAHHMGPVFTVIDKYDDSGNQSSKSQQSVTKRQAKTRKRLKKELVLKTIPEIHQELFMVVETLKSQMVSLDSTRLLIAKGLLPEDADMMVYSTYVAELADRLRRIPGAQLFGRYQSLPLASMLLRPHSEMVISAIIEFNFLMGQEALIYNIADKKLDIDQYKFASAVRKLAASALKHADNSKHFTVRQFISVNTRLTPQLEAVWNNLREISTTTVLGNMPGSPGDHD